MKFTTFTLIVLCALGIMHIANYAIGVYQYKKYFESRIEYHNTHKTHSKVEYYVNPL